MRRGWSVQDDLSQRRSFELLGRLNQRLSFMFMTAALAGVAVLIATPPSSADRPMRFLGPPIAVVTHGPDGISYTVAARVNQPVPASRDFDLVIGTRRGHSLYGNGGSTYRIGRTPGRYCYYASGLGTGQGGLPGSLRTAQKGRLVTVALAPNNGAAIRTSVRVRRASVASAANEAAFVRELSCGRGAD